MKRSRRSYSNRRQNHRRGLHAAGDLLAGLLADIEELDRQDEVATPSASHQAAPIGGRVAGGLGATSQTTFAFYEPVGV